MHERLVRAYKQGVEIRALKERFGISIPKIYEILKNAGLPMRAPRKIRRQP